jgi:hypothetical protein
MEYNRKTGNQFDPWRFKRIKVEKLERYMEPKYEFQGPFF